MCGRQDVDECDADCYETEIANPDTIVPMPLAMTMKDGVFDGL